MRDLGQRRWICGAFLLLTLIAGVLVSGFDMLEDHSAPRVTGNHTENGTRPLHLVRYHASKAAPCSVCFFHKILGHGLVAAQEAPPDTDSATHRIPERLAAPCRAAFDLEVTRGPPSTC
jgi:hypothetical protein